MAQLIKLEDYISRYEKDLYHYSSQYIRLKRENWQKTNEERELAKQVDIFQEDKYTSDNFAKKSSPFSKLNFFKRNKQEKQVENDVTETNQFRDQFKLATLNEDELKRYFLNKLYPFQLKWATSTLSEVSFVDPKYNDNREIKYFLQRFPDTYFLMYHPVFDIQSAILEADIIFISPIGIEIISIIEFSQKFHLMAGNERTWHIEGGEIKEQILNPAISLSRTEKIIKSILKQKEINFPITKTILSRKNKIIYGTEPYKTQIIDSSRYDEWLEMRRTLNSPIKSIQLKATDAILQYCRTSAVKRPEWEDEERFLPIEDEIEDNE